MGKRITILVIPEGHDKIRTFYLPRIMPLVSLVLGIVFTLGLGGLAVTAFLRSPDTSEKDAEIARLRQKAIQQNVQIYAFADKMRLLEQEMAKLQQFDRKLRVMTGKGPLAKEAIIPGLGGSDSTITSPEAALKPDPEKLVRQMHRDIDRLLSSTTLQEQSQQELGKLIEDTRSLIASTPDGWPTRGSVSSLFGYRDNPFGGGRQEFHKGVDITAPYGAAVLAPADGLVVGNELESGYGLVVTLNHGYGVVTRFAHLSQAFVEPGQRVKRGDKIGAVGASGRTTGTHLHYETHLNGMPVNPMRFLAGKE